MLRYRRTAIKELREEEGLPLDDLARRAKLTTRNLRYLERGPQIPRADTLARLAQALGVGIGMFFEQSETEAER